MYGIAIIKLKNTKIGQVDGLLFSPFITCTAVLRHSCSVLGSSGFKPEFKQFSIVKRQIAHSKIILLSRDYEIFFQIELDVSARVEIKLVNFTKPNFALT